MADIERFLNNSKIEHTLGDMGTVICGPIEELLSLAAELHNLPFARGAERVVTQITIDERLDIERKIGDKRLSVLNRINKDSNK